ncbi:hypothetical protein [Bradyrhizobium sp. AZCC 1693]|uniref:hypothetical protein n=1 Tax=Bradyrhizobium sp. AZCC 1693 TaxID=3117029 RepID=UPI002FF14955
MAGTAEEFIKKASDYRKVAEDLESRKKDLKDKYDSGDFAPLLRALLDYQPSSSVGSSISALKSVGSAIGQFFQSGTFYFFAGLTLLLYAAHVQQESSTSLHPSLLFLLAILGVAILLFGTGSQSKGAIATGGAALPSSSDNSNGEVANSGKSDILLPPDHPAVVAEESIKTVQSGIIAANTKATDAEKVAGLGAAVDPANLAVKAAEAARLAASKRPSIPLSTERGDWGPVKANAAVAGGAAVLAALFGWGIIHFSPDIRKVFSRDDNYEKIYISACAAYKPVCNLDELPKDSTLSEFTLGDYDISASMDNGTPIPMVRDDRRIRLVLLSEDTRNSKYFWLTIKRNKNQERTDFRKTLTLPVRLGPKEPNAQYCATFEGASEQVCPLSALRLEGQVSSEDRARTKVYSLNFFGVRDPNGLVTTSATVVIPTPAGSAPPPAAAVTVEYDLTVQAGAKTQ